MADEPTKSDDDDFVALVSLYHSDTPEVLEIMLVLQEMDPSIPGALRHVADQLETKLRKMKAGLN